MDTDHPAKLEGRPARAMVLRLALAALTLLRLWLPTAQSIRAVGRAAFDDRLFLYQAEHIVNGTWLGPYGFATLAKCQMFPIFVALSYAAHIPLPIAQDLLYVIACLAIVGAVAPAVPSPRLRAALYLLLLYHPMSYDSFWLARVIRSQVNTSLAILTIAGAVGIATHRAASRGALLAWTALFGVSLGAFWTTREESPWIAPVLAVLMSGIVAWLWRDDRTALRAVLPRYLSGAALAAALVASIAAVNYANYGLFVISEHKSAAYEAAYGALSRVEPSAHRRLVPVPRVARERAYTVSPAFAELRPYLEGPRGHYWAEVSAPWIGDSAGELEMGGGWFLFAFRDAVQERFGFESADAAAAYYRRVAREINDACARGAIRCGPPRATLVPVVVREDYPRIAKNVALSIKYLVTYEAFDPWPYPSIGDEPSLELFRRMTRARVAPILPSGTRIPVTRLEAAQLRALELIGRAYQLLTPPLVGLALILWITAFARSLRKRRVTLLFSLATSCLCASIGGCALIGFLEATAFPAINTAYLAPFYATMLLFAWSMVAAFALPRSGAGTGGAAD